MASSRSYTPPCAACKLLRRKCMPSECIFWPYFPPQDHQKFQNVRKIFGASNVAKHLNEVLPHQRCDAANSLAYEAEARVRDPVYGCVGVIASLHRQVQRLQKELDAANADLVRLVCGVMPPPAAAPWVNRLQKELDAANADLVRFACGVMPPPAAAPWAQQRAVEFDGTFYQTGDVQNPSGVGWSGICINPCDGGKHGSN